MLGWYIIILPLFFLSNLTAQHIFLPGQSKLNDPSGGLVSEIPIRELDTEGDNYFNDEWLVGNVYLTNGDSIINYPLKLDLVSRFLDIRVSSSVRMLGLNRIDSVVWATNDGDQQNFITGSRFKNIDNMSIFEVLSVRCNAFLLVEHDLELIKSNYVVQLNAGNRHDKFFHTFKYYLSVSDSAFVIKKNMRKNTDLFGSHFELIRTYVKENRIKLKDRDELIELFKVYSSLLCH